MLNGVILMVIVVNLSLLANEADPQCCCMIQSQYQRFTCPVLSFANSRREFKIFPPSDLQQLIELYHPCRTLLSQDARFQVVPRVSKIRMGVRAFSYYAPVLWNYLPVSLKEADILSTLKSKFKKCLFDKS